MYGMKLGSVVFIAINVLIHKIVGFHIDDEEIKKLLILMQYKLLHGQSRTQDIRSRNHNVDLIDNDRTFTNLNNLNDVTRTNVEGYEENPMTIFILKAKDKPKVSLEDTIVKNLLKEIILHEKLSHKKYPVKSQPNFKTNDLSNEINNLKKYSKLFIILNTSPNRNALNGKDLEDIGGLLSKLLANKVSNIVEKKKRYYKGFVINDDESSRRRRDSDESEADDYRPKRSRIKNSGSVGGRTFAPSMGKKRHVYETE